MKKYHIFSLVTNTIYIFSRQQTEAVSTIHGLMSPRKDLECAVLVWYYTMGVSTLNIETDVKFDVTLELT